MEILYKFGVLDPEDKPWEHADQWTTEATSNGGQRLVIAPRKGHIELLFQMLQAMPEPLGLLYVLVVPRGGSKPGRYQCSEPQTKDAMETFLRHYSSFLEEDGRHNLWIASVSTSAMLVYDRHNVIYAYGPLAEWRTVLLKAGLKEVATIRVPTPHSHHYHDHLDAQELHLTSTLDWKLTPVRASDEE